MCRSQNKLTRDKSNNSAKEKNPENKNELFVAKNIKP